MILAFGGDMENFKMSGSGMTICGGILLLILSVLILLNPFGAGVASVLIVAGVGLIVFGCIFCMLAMKLRRIHEEFEMS
jgi:uncharacterized membrane protein HdeD (DUF308 family)